jgi:hypothetical protein
MVVMARPTRRGRCHGVFCAWRHWVVFFAFYSLRLRPVLMEANDAQSEDLSGLLNLLRDLGFHGVGVPVA